MSKFSFHPATKAEAKARLAFAGPSGSGKTYTGLLVARRLAGPEGKVAVIDTERGSASKYADEFDFDTLQVHTFDPRDLVKALAAAGAAGYPVVLVDSLSHYWMGVGGMLELVDAAAKRSGGGNSFAGWKEARPHERRMIDALLAYDGHVIVTMRTKTEYVVEEDSRGRKVPRKIGLKPEQRDGVEYEFDVVGDMDLENTLTVTKTRCRALNGVVVNRPGVDFADTVLEWLRGTPARTVADFRSAALRPDATYAELRVLWNEVRDAGRDGAAVLAEDGEPMSLGDLIAAQGLAAKGREMAAEQQGAAA